MSSTTKTVTKAAGIMMAAIFLSRILGLLRDMIIANQFGVGGPVSAYQAAFNLPDLLYFLLSSGALSSAFIPVFTEYWTKGQKDEAWKVFSIIGTFMFLVLSGLIIVCEIFTPQLVSILARGFMKDHKELFDLTVFLTRIVLPSQLFFFIGGLIIGTLHSRQHFLAPALGPIIYNICIIAGAILLADRFGISGLTWGALVGAFIGNFLLQIAVVKRMGVQFKPSLNLRHPGVVKVAKLALPVMLGLSLPYIDVILNRSFASFLGENAIAALGYANRLMQVPLGVFAQAGAVALFPTLAAHAALKEMGELRSSANFGLRAILLMTVPCAVLMMVMSTEIVTMLFRHGDFSASDAPYVGYALAFYAIGIPGWAGQAIVARGFYAIQETRTPVITGTIVTLIFVPMSWMLMKTPLAHGGLALATSISVVLYMLLLLEILRRKIGGINGRLLIESVTKVAICSAVMGAVAWVVVRYVGQAVGTDTASRAFITVLAALVPSVLVYVGMITLLKVDEAREVWKVISSRFRRRRSAI